MWIRPPLVPLMLTGKLPFDGETPQALVAKVMVERPIPPNERRPDLHIAADLEALIMSALAPDRDARPASAEDFRRALLSCPLPGAYPSRSTPAPAHATMVLEARSTPGGSPILAADARAGSTRPITPAAAAPPSGPRLKARTPASERQVTPRPGQRGATPRGLPRPISHPVKVALEDEEDAEPVSPPPAEEPRASKLPLVLVLAGAGAVLCAVAAWAILGSSGGKTVAAVSPPAASVSQVQPPAAPVGPVEPPAAVPAAPSETATPPESPVATPEPTLAQDDATARAQDSEPPAGRRPVRHARRGPTPIREVGEALNSLTTPPAASGEGILTIDVTPWAHVSINGRDIGDTPREVRMVEGTYRVRVSHPELGSTERTVRVPAGGRERFVMSLAR